MYNYEDRICSRPGQFQQPWMYGDMNIEAPEKMLHIFDEANVNVCTVVSGARLDVSRGWNIEGSMVAR